MVSTQATDAGQRQLALDPLRSFCVTAPAGSGKTELLIQRLLTLLARVEQPEEVLAITFTRKAAAEMRARIVDALERALDDRPPTDAHRALTWKLARGALENDREQGWDLLTGPARLNIKTIDSYCAGLTRQMPVLSSFGSSVAPVDDARPYYLEATRAMLELLESSHPVAADLADIMLHFHNNWPRLENLLVSMLARRDQWLAYIGVDLHGDSAEQALQRTVRTLVQDHLQSLGSSLASFRGEILDSLDYSHGNLGLEAVAEFPGTQQADLENWRAVANLLLTGTGSWRKQVDKRQGFPAGTGAAEKAQASARKEQLKAVIAELQPRDGLLEQLQLVRHLPDINDDPQRWQTLLTLCRVLPVLAAQLSVVFQQHGVVDHAQVSMAAREALGDDDAPTLLAQKLDYKLRHILLDEFQDTSVNQFELVRRLTRGWAQDNRANPGNPNTLFIVGDGMQSIYGFREADVGLFIKAKHEGFNDIDLQPLDLAANFRSDAPLVEWVNNAFGTAFPPVDNLQRGEIAFSPSVPQRPATIRSPVEMLAFSDEDEELARAAEAEHLATLIATGVADATCTSIAVLVRTRNHLTPIIQALKARNITWQAQDIDSLASSSVVVDLQTLCQALHNLADDAAWLALLRAPWCGMDLADLLVLAGGRGDASLWARMQDAEMASRLSADGANRLHALNSILGRALARRERLSLRAWIEQAWLDLGGPATVRREEQLADAREFLDLLEEMDVRGEPYAPSTMTERVSRLYSQDSSADSKVQLMTLHKSKGLEFDWVIIPALGRTTAADKRELLAWHEYHGLAGETGFLLAMDDQQGRDELSLYNYLSEANKRKRQLEATRLLYVGCTRARKQLFLSATLTAAADAWKPPAARSLLHSIWPVFEVGCELLQPELPAPAQALPEAGIRRLRSVSTLPAAPATETDADDSNIPQQPRNKLQRHAGTVIHLTLQRLSAYSEGELAQFEPGQYDSWWQKQLRALGLDSDQLEQAHSLVRQSLARVLADQRGRWLLSREREDAHSEYALSCLRPDGRLAEYIIDRSYVDNDVRWVVDYKSSVPEADEPLEKFLQRERERYGPQLRRYRDAYSGLETRPVKTALYFTSLAHWLECE
jgi:ATP-dependent exoDNAse (exonuclease V) beta subunit